MHINKLPQEFVTARPVMRKIEQAGYQAYFVGGSVRDTILGIPIHDVDIASSAYPAEIKALFHKTVDTGIEHGTVMVLDHGNGYEITTFRTESGYQDYRRPDHVKFVRSLKEDLKRRDFTINALAMRENGDVIDLFDGIGDLKRHLIRAVGDPNIRFNEDALRMMRAVRFASKLNFDIDPDTLAAIHRHSSLLAKIAVERIHEEFVKMMMGQDPNQGLIDMVETGMYQYVPDFAAHQQALTQLSQGQILHLDSEVAVWGLIVYQFKLSRSEIGSFLKHWKSANQIIKNTQLVCAGIDTLVHSIVSALTIYHNGLENMLIADQVAVNLGYQSQKNRLKALYDRLPIKTDHELKINGGILIQERVVKPGPKLGKLLAKLEQLVITGQVANNEKVLIQESRKLMK